jgi:hypothetical protein
VLHQSRSLSPTTPTCHSFLQAVNPSRDNTSLDPFIHIGAFCGVFCIPPFVPCASESCSMSDIYPPRPSRFGDQSGCWSGRTSRQEPRLVAADMRRSALDCTHSYREVFDEPDASRKFDHLPLAMLGSSINVKIIRAKQRCGGYARRR